MRNSITMSVLVEKMKPTIDAMQALEKGTDEEEANEEEDEERKERKERKERNERKERKP